MTQQKLDSLFSVREQKAWDTIIEAMVAIQEMDERGRLAFNTDELATSIHVLQGFVKQHILWRLDPEEFSDWWDDGKKGN
jgi:hypothetical protein